MKAIKPITLKDLLSLVDNGGITLEDNKPITFNSGYQVGLRGKETKSARIALKYIKDFNGNAGVWFSKQVFYIDESIHVESLDKAIELGKQHNQQSILDWSTMELIWL